jgi:hypothetical protein
MKYKIIMSKHISLDRSNYNNDSVNCASQGRMIFKLRFIKRFYLQVVCWMIIKGQTLHAIEGAEWSSDITTCAGNGGCSKSRTDFHWRGGRRGPRTGRIGNGEEKIFFTHRFSLPNDNISKTLLILCKKIWEKGNIFSFISYSISRQVHSIF